MEVNFEEHHAKALSLDFMYDLMENEDPIQNIPAFREGRLVRMMDPGAIRAALMAYPLAKIRNSTLRTMIVQNCRMPVAPETFGIKEMIS